jgi:hypothetical protein
MSTVLNTALALFRSDDDLETYLAIGLLLVSSAVLYYDQYR